MRKRRYAKCQKCGEKWNVSRQLKIGEQGYICPVCQNKKQKGKNKP